MNKVKNFVIERFAKHLLDGNKGTNILNVVLTPVLAANVDYMLAFQGFQHPFQDYRSTVEVIKVAGIILNAALLYLIGKYPKIAKLGGIVTKTLEAAEAAAIDTAKSTNAGLKN